MTSLLADASHTTINMAKIIDIIQTIPTLTKYKINGNTKKSVPSSDKIAQSDIGINFAKFLILESINAN